MIDHGFRYYSHLVAGKLHSPAQVDLLHVSEESVIKTSELPVKTASYHKACSCRPEYVGRGVILTMVSLKVLQYSSSAERIAEKIQTAAGRSGIFELLPFLPAVQFRCACSAFRMFLHPSYKRLKPSVCNLDVRVYQHEKV